MISSAYLNRAELDGQPLSEDKVVGFLRVLWSRHRHDVERHRGLPVAPGADPGRPRALWSARPRFAAGH